MTRPLALLRPEPGWSASAAAARAAGIEVIGHPLFEAQPVAWTIPNGRFDALLVGSATVFRLGGDALGQLRHLPVHAVGETTATIAHASGFAVAETGEGGLQAVLDEDACSSRHFLRLAGEERVTLRPHPGQTISEVCVYRMASLPFSANFAASLGVSRPIVALHSAAAATHFAQEVDRLGLIRGQLALLALGPRIVEAAGSGWAATYLAERPSDAALLAKAGTLCK